MSRSLGWTLLTTRSPIEIVPEVMFSNPASIRSRVDLPQPEGPTRTTNSPSSIGIDTPCKTPPPSRTLRTIIRRVRCGRNDEQAAYLCHQTQTPVQRVVQQPAQSGDD